MKQPSPWWMCNRAMPCRFIVALPVWLLLTTGCGKEYSYEWQPELANTVVVPQTPAVVASCHACKTTTLPDSSWRLTFDGVVYCGVVDKAIITPERTAFTFFGPSFCSPDSGFVASVAIENGRLDSDKTGVWARLGCYYYDNINQTYLFMSEPSKPLRLTIARYEHQTRTATGTFSGVITDANGVMREVKKGEFHFRF